MPVETQERIRVVLFYHSLVSDWNHGNAHFLRGVAAALQERGHDVIVYEPEGGWSFANLRTEPGGDEALREFHAIYPGLVSRRYRDGDLDLDEALAGADLVIVHEWNEHGLVARIGRHRYRSSYRLLFHDTHHRSVTDTEAMGAYDLAHYDGVLAYGEVIRRIYLERGWAQRAWTWHEAADVRVFHPREEAPEGDLVWVGNWGDGERSRELEEFLIRPVAELGLRARIHGVRYPAEALSALARARIAYGGWLPNFAAPRIFARHRVTVHVPRRPYVEALPGIPTIRPFEALACGIPLVCSPWEDCEGLFRAGRDYLVARDGSEMKKHLRAILADPSLTGALKTSGLETIRARHTCGHRVDELLRIHQSLTKPQEERNPAA
jgi:spore maturation protein CgeB